MSNPICLVSVSVSKCIKHQGTERKTWGSNGTVDVDGTGPGVAAQSKKASRDAIRF